MIYIFWYVCSSVMKFCPYGVVSMKNNLWYLPNIRYAQHIAVYQDFIADSWFPRFMAHRNADVWSILWEDAFFCRKILLFQFVCNLELCSAHVSRVCLNRRIKEPEMSNMQKVLYLVNINYYLVRFCLLLISFASRLSYLTFHCCLQK